MRAATTLTSDLHPPRAGPGSDPVLYGVAAGLESLFPPVSLHVRALRDADDADDSPDRREAAGSD
ncbi:hypothetical protein MMSR116_21345 [Methylobacterium mesophilicum SR1.6/6]|uniref:Uncharacterized protein n=1 Tax=Methylobacterium mesophilicum SR1.6/6 TaxID=908290 RepID=A0A6B9FT19_9HYPH|nr:hypothetical protein MMSR116_21345 [Methylobacterium mesophilicum SR1.6/6]